MPEFLAGTYTPRHQQKHTRELAHGGKTMQPHTTILARAAAVTAAAASRARSGGARAALALGVLAAGGAGAVAAAGPASASPAVAPVTCTPQGNYYLSVTANGVSYYLGTRKTASSGSPAILKPAQDATTLWANLACTNGNNLLENRGLALTSTATSTGANVTLKPAGNGGTGFASQQWFTTCANPSTCSAWDFNNVNTALWLMIRSSSPVMGQTVTTGGAPTDWTHS
jgi:hypothetical protein